MRVCTHTAERKNRHSQRKELDFREKILICYFLFANSHAVPVKITELAVVQLQIFLNYLFSISTQRTQACTGFVNSQLLCRI